MNQEVPEWIMKIYPLLKIAAIALGIWVGWNFTDWIKKLKRNE
jgi:hypothetical protein